MAEQPWFDTRAGGMLLQDAAEIAAAVDEAGPAVQPLSDLLSEEPFPFGPFDFEKLDVEDWTKERYLAAARWIVDIMTTETTQEGPVLSEKLLERAYWLGLVPAPSRYKRNGLPLIRLAEELNTVTQYAPRGHFDRWSTPQFETHARKVSASIGGKRPTREDYETYGKTHPNSPTLKIILRHMGTTNILNDLIGFPDSTTWDDEDFIQYGGRIAAANGEDMVKFDTITILSARDRGPSYPNIVKRFGTWKAYKKQVVDYLHVKAIERQRKLVNYQHQIAEGALPAAYAELDDNTLLSHAARYVLLDDFAQTRRLASEQKQAIVETGYVNAYVKAVRSVSPGLRETDIRVKAELRNIQDDIWTQPTQLKYLRVNPKEFEPLRQRNRERLRAIRQRRAA